MRATIYDVAERAKVSIATVSRVLNGRAKVTDETRARVMEAVEALNYRPSPVARGLAMRATSVLGLFHQSFQSNYAAQVISGAESEAAACGFALLAIQIEGKEWADLMRMPGRADGVIVTASPDNEAFLQALAHAGTPTVLLGHARHDLKMDGVVPDNSQGTVAALEHLVAHGRKRIAHIAGPHWSTNAVEREQAYRATMAEHGLAVPDGYLQVGEYNFISGTTAMEKLLALPEPPDAVFCANDMMAMGAMQAIAGAALRVPEDIAVVGFDGLEAGEYMTPPLSTVFQPLEDIGRIAVRLLVDRIKSPDAAVQEEVVATKLIARGSCGAPDEHEDME